MLITMLLLISGLILSSATLVHFAMDGKEGEAWEAIVNSAAGGGKEFSEKMQAAGEPGEPVEEPSAATASSSSDSSIMRFFSGGGGGGKSSVRWPKLKVAGFGKSTDTEAGFAIINGKHVLVNNFIGEVQLVEIRAHGAVVEYKGEQKVLSVER
jgi:hypothetical protein